MKARYFLLIFIFGILFFSVEVAHGVAIRVKPSQLRIETSLREFVRAEIVVSNPTEEVLLFEVYPDDFSEMVKINPESFTLESKAEKKIILELRTKTEEIFLTTISVIARPLAERGFSAAAGVKIPLEVRSESNKDTLFLAAISRNIRSLLSGEEFFFLGTIFIFIISVLALNSFKRRKFGGENYYDSPAWRIL